MLYFSHTLVIESLFLARVNEDVMLMVIGSIGVEKDFVAKEELATNEQMTATE